MNILDVIIGPVFKIIDKIIPDPQAKAAAQLKILELNQAGEFKQLDADLQLSLAQIKVNEVEAAAPGLFRGGWRPAVGWVGVLGMAYMVLMRPLLPWFATVMGFDVPPLPPVDTEETFALLMGILGLGGMRTVERLKGRA